MKCNHHLDCQHACIHHVPIFKDLTTEEKQKILDTSMTKTFLKGEMIFSSIDSSNNLWVVNTGKVKVSKISTDGKEQVIRILQQGDFLGDLSLFSQETMNSEAFALEKSEICIISGHHLKTLICQHPEIALKFLKVYSERIQKAEEMIEQMGIYDVDKRIIKTLLNEFKQSNSSEILLAYSKADFASMIGTTRETLSRKLSKYQQNGWIQLSGQRKIKILDVKRLEEELYKE